MMPPLLRRRLLHFLLLYFLFLQMKRFGPVSIYRPKQPDFADTASTRSVRLVFFPVRNKGVIYTSALTGTVYTGRIGRYDTKLISLF